MTVEAKESLELIREKNYGLEQHGFGNLDVSGVRVEEVSWPKQVM